MIPVTADVRQVLEMVVERWGRAERSEDWETTRSRVPVGEEGLLGGIGALARVNAYQWHLEDCCRGANADLSRLGNLKKAIDLSNARRVDLIDSLNQQVQAALHPIGEVDPLLDPLLDTPGSAYDRLSILTIRCMLSKNDLSRQDLVITQIDDLCRALDRAMEALREGRLRMSVPGTLKIYRS